MMLQQQPLFRPLFPCLLDRTLQPQPQLLVCCRMPASGTMAAPFGRVMSGRGFAPGSFQPYDIPAAGQYTKDLPVVGNRSSVDAWIQQAKMAKNLQLFGTGFLNNTVSSTTGELGVLEQLLMLCLHHDVLHKQLARFASFAVLLALYEDCQPSVWLVCCNQSTCPGAAPHAAQDNEMANLSLIHSAV